MIDTEKIGLSISRNSYGMTSSIDNVMYKVVYSSKIYIITKQRVIGKFKESNRQFTTWQ